MTVVFCGASNMHEYGNGDFQMKKVYVVAMGLILSLAPLTAFAGTVYSRAWCKHSSHGSGGGQGGGAYPWISYVFVTQTPVAGDATAECWEYVRKHEVAYPGHDAGCSYTRADGTIN